MDWTQVELSFIPKKLHLSLQWLTNKFNQACRTHGMNQERVSEYRYLAVEMVDRATMAMAHRAAPQDQLDIMTGIRMGCERLPDYDPNSSHPYPTVDIDVESLIPSPGPPQTAGPVPTSMPHALGPPPQTVDMTVDDEEVPTLTEGWTFTETSP